jgi:hypothetical protein
MIKIALFVTITCQPATPYPGADPGFQIRGGGALIKIAPSEGRHEIFGVFRVKIHDFTPKKQITESPSYP